MPSLIERASVIPGRSLTRSKKVFGRWALHAEGAVITDVDGNDYIDMLCALWAVSLGYQPVLFRGAPLYSFPHRVEVHAAEAVLKHVAPWASHVRFTKTGSEATHAAYRIAKAATGRDIVIVGSWAYHGWHEWCSGCSDGVVGIPLGYAMENVLHREHIAAVIVEPPRFKSVDSGWFAHLREYCTDIGALLVFDEMIYGGRVALGGATEYYGVIPDLACYGKAIGNGQAVACVVGREALAEHGEIASGTYSGDAGGLYAVCDTLDTYTTEPVIETLWARGKQLADGLDALVAKHPGLAVREGLPVHQRLRFINSEHGERFTQLMLERGVIWHPGCVNVMYAHTLTQIEQVLVAAEDACQAL